MLGIEMKRNECVEMRIDFDSNTYAYMRPLKTVINPASAHVDLAKEEREKTAAHTHIKSISVYDQ